MKRKFALFLFAVALLIPQSASLQSSFEPSRERIAAHVSYLASDKLQGRRAGTEGAELAARYIAKQFRDLRLKPAAANFLQPFSFVASVRLGKENRFEVKTPQSRSLKVEEDFMPLAFSASTLVSASVVFTGYGISAPELQYDNYSGDVTGKIVVLLRGSPDGDNPHSRFAEYTAPGLEVQKKTLKAREKGARGVIFISPEQNFRDDRLSRLRHEVNFLDAGIPAVVISRKAADALLASEKSSVSDIEKRAKENPSPLPLDATVEFKTDVVKVEGKGSNVVGILQGSDPQLSSEYIVIGAHYDHLGLGGSESLAARPEGEIHHGADDNASGTSALIELARVMTAARPKRSVVFIAFSAEELGLLGSAAYTKTPVVPLSSTIAMLNMDMVGRLRNDSLTIGGVGTSPAWQALLEKLNATANGNRFKMSFNQDGFGPSDHQSFYVRDVPVLFFFTGTHDDYHKPSDTAEKINTEGASRIAALVRDIALSIANESQRIAFTKVKVESRPAGRGFRVYLGTVPSYGDSQDGLKLDGVRAGSPAEKAGLKAGDVITKIGKFPIKNVYDYTFALGELRAGEEVEVVIRRDGREQTLKLTPEKRS
jgi:hypothetical protein